MLPIFATAPCCVELLGALAQAFTPWRGWGADSAATLLAGCLFCVCLGSGSFYHDRASHCSALLWSLDALFVFAYGAINDPLRFCNFCWLEASCSWNWCMHNWRHVTGLGWGGDVNVHVNLRHMHNWRHVTGLGWGGDVNVHVNLRHMHIWRHVTGLGLGGDVNVHVNLRHMHNWRHVSGLGWGGDVTVTFMLTCVTCTTDVTSLGWGGVGMLTFMLTCVTCTTDVTHHIVECSLWRRFLGKDSLQEPSCWIAFGKFWNNSLFPTCELAGSSITVSTVACWTRLKPSCTDTMQVITCGRNWESWPKKVDAEDLAR